MAATISNQATLRTSLNDWLNRSDLTNAQLDQFVEMAESKIYEQLRIPPLEKEILIDISDTSSIPLPSDFLELIEIRKTGTGTCSVVPGTNTSISLCEAADGVWSSGSLSDDIILQRSDTRVMYASNKHALPHSFARDGTKLVITDEVGRIEATGVIRLKYYKIVPPIGDLYSNGEVFRSTETFCDSLLRQSNAAAGATWVAYSPSNGYGDCTIDYSDVEKIEWLLNGDYEIVLYATLAIASEFLGNDEDVAKYTRLYMEKIRATNERATKAERSGGNISMSFPNFQGL